MKLKKIVSMIIVAAMISTSSAAFAVDLSQSDANVAISSSQAPALSENQMQSIQENILRSSQGKVLNIPGNQGTLTSNCWRSTKSTTSGNTIQWDWQVSAVYSGSKTVESIKTEWYSTADLRNSACLTMGISGDGITASSGSQWYTYATTVKYWTNDNGSTSSDYLGNIVIGPSVDYKENTICTYNTAYVKLSGDPKTYSIKAGV